MKIDKILKADCVDGSFCLTFFYEGEWYELSIRRQQNKSGVFTEKHLLLKELSWDDTKQLLLETTHNDTNFDRLLQVVDSYGKLTLP